MSDSSDTAEATPPPPPAHGAQSGTLDAVESHASALSELAASLTTASSSETTLRHEHDDDGEEHALDSHEVIELQAFSERKDWIMDKIKVRSPLIKCRAPFMTPIALVSGDTPTYRGVRRPGRRSRIVSRDSGAPYTRGAKSMGGRARQNREGDGNLRLGGPQKATQNHERCAESFHNRLIYAETLSGSRCPPKFVSGGHGPHRIDAHNDLCARQTTASVKR